LANIVEIHEASACQRNAWIRIHVCDRSSEGIRTHTRIRVEHRNIAASGNFESPIVSGGEAKIVMGSNQLNFRKFARDHISRIVLRIVVYNDHLEWEGTTLPSYRRQASTQEVASVEGNYDY
jgi:hypothetical protein